MADNYSPSRFRVIAGTLYAREPKPSAHFVRVHELGNRQIEASILPHYAWHEVDALSDSAMADYAMSAGHIYVDGKWVPASADPQTLLDRAARNLARSAARATTAVRRLVKSKGLTTMMTLTYQDNMQDRSRMVRDFDVFVKRVRRVAPGFEYVCVFERQKRGAWHAHIACARVLSHYMHKGYMVRSYDLLRSMWRGVIGAGGNVDVSRRGAARRSLAKLASYLAKYISKGFQSGNFEGGDSYRASGRALPRPSVFRVAGTLADGMSVLADLLHPELASILGDRLRFSHTLLDGGGYFCSLSPPS